VGHLYLLFPNKLRPGTASMVHQYCHLMGTRMLLSEAVVYATRLHPLYHLRLKGNRSLAIHIIQVLSVQCPHQEIHSDDLHSQDNISSNLNMILNHPTKLIMGSRCPRHIPSSNHTLGSLHSGNAFPRINSSHNHNPNHHHLTLWTALSCFLYPLIHLRISPHHQCLRILRKICSSTTLEDLWLLNANTPARRHHLVYLV
jgi:hypothetical protein